MKSPAVLIARILEEHNAWLKATETNVRKDRGQVAKLLERCRDSKTANHAATIFSGIPSLTWATQSIVRGMKSESGGESLLALHTEERWLETFHRYPGYPYIQRDALLFLSFQMWDRCSWLFPRLNPAHPSKQYHIPGEVWTMRHPLEFYCHCLWSRLEGRIPEDSEVLSSGPYSGIFHHWDNPDSLASAISVACDYHLNRAFEPEGYEINEFTRAPFTLLPVEILALRAVRQKLGLPMPEVAHPLLNSPLVANLPPTLPKVHDDLLDQLQAAVAGFL